MLKTHCRALLSLGLPIMIGQLGIIILGFADTMMIGHHSTPELAAASFVNNVMNMVIIFCTGFSYGLTPVVGSLFGQGERAEAGQALRCSLLSNTLVGLVLSAVMLVVLANVHRMGQPAELIPLIRPYMLVCIVSIPFVMLFNGFKQFTDGITDTRTAMWLLIGGNVLNIVGNYILIYGKLGMPELGLLGAGLSTLLSRIVMVAAFAWIFFRSRRFLRYGFGFRRMGWSKSTLKRLNKLGWPIAFQMGMETASFSVLAIMVGWLGTIALASHQVMITISTFTFMIYYGLGAAVAVRVSNYHGKGDLPECRRVAFSGLFLMVCLELSLGSLVFLMRGVMGSWFTDNTEVSLTVATLVVPFLIYQFGDGLQITFSNALRGLADVRALMGIAFVAYFVVSIPLAYVFGFVCGWGILGVWFSTPFGLTTAGTLMWLRFRRLTKAAREAGKA